MEVMPLAGIKGSDIFLRGNNSTFDKSGTSLLQTLGNSNEEKFLPSTNPEPPSTQAVFLFGKQSTRTPSVSHLSHTCVTPQSHPRRPPKKRMKRAKQKEEP